MALSGPRLRQLVFASDSIDRAADLKFLLGLGDYYSDPGVGLFGLDNAVFSVGDQFLEIVVPKTDRDAEDTAVGRFLKRNGAGGYMAIFEIPDIEKARQRADELNIRRIWNADLPEIAASHLHPVDVGSAILSLDQAMPTGSWLWGGPDWQKNSVPGSLTGATVAINSTSTAKRWADVLDLPLAGDQLALQDGAIIFEETSKQSGLSAFHIGLPNLDDVIARADKLNLPIEQNIITFEGVQLHMQPI